MVQGRGHCLMHGVRVGPLDKIGIVAVAHEQRLQLLVRNTGKDCRVCNLVAVEMQHRQHRTVARRIEKLVRVPRRGKRPGLRFAVADHDHGDEVGVVEDRAVGVRHRIAELSALVDRAGRLRRAMAADPAGEGELLEQAAHAVGILGDLAVDLRVRAFQVDIRDQRRRAVSRTGEEDDVEIVFLDQPVEMDVDQAHAGIGAPVSQQPSFDMLGLERLAQQRIIAQVDHSRRQIQGRVPVTLHPLELLRLQRAATHAGPRGAVSADRSDIYRGRVHVLLRDRISGRHCAFASIRWTYDNLADVMLRENVG